MSDSADATANPAPAAWAKDPRFKTGLKPTPRHKLAAATPFMAPARHQMGLVAKRSIAVPPFLEMWLNDQFGSCVTTEEAAAIAMYSIMLGLPEVKITDATVRAFCDKYDFLNGAYLTEVMDKMISDGFHQDAGYKDGPYNSVDYSNEAILQSALEQGPVKIGIDSSALPSGAGNANGWHDSGGRAGQYQNEDHCVGLWNYGPSAALFAALNAPVPDGFPATGYHLFTWSTIGVVDHAWIMSTCGEAWVRNPTTVGFTPGPQPPPPPGPTALSAYLTVTNPPDAVGSYAVGAGGNGGLSPAQTATVEQAISQLQGLLVQGDGIDKFYAGLLAHQDIDIGARARLTTWRASGKAPPITCLMVLVTTLLANPGNFVAAIQAFVVCMASK